MRHYVFSHILESVFIRLNFWVQVGDISFSGCCTSLSLIPPSRSWSINSIWIHSSQVSRTASVLLPMLSSSNLYASHRHCHVPEYCTASKIDSNRAIFYYSWSDVQLESHCYIALDSVAWRCQENMPRKRPQIEVKQNVSEACSMALQEYLWR